MPERCCLPTPFPGVFRLHAIPARKGCLAAAAPAEPAALKLWARTTNRCAVSLSGCSGFCVLCKGVVCVLVHGYVRAWTVKVTS